MFYRRDNPTPTPEGRSFATGAGAPSSRLVSTDLDLDRCRHAGLDDHALDLALASLIARGLARLLLGPQKAWNPESDAPSSNQPDCPSGRRAGASWRTNLRRARLSSCGPVESPAGPASDAQVGPYFAPGSDGITGSGATATGSATVAVAADEPSAASPPPPRLSPSRRHVAMAVGIVAAHEVHPRIGDALPRHTGGNVPGTALGSIGFRLRRQVPRPPIH